MNEAPRIFFERTGGFAGIAISVTVDAKDLPADEMRRLEAMLNEADFFGLPEKISKQPAQPDRFHYEMAVQYGNRRHSVNVDEQVMPEKLAPLLRYLLKKARAA
jgi:hypothetical protein